MKTEIFLVLIIIILIYSNNTIIKNDPYDKNFRYLDSNDSDLNPSNTTENDTDSNSTDSNEDPDSNITSPTTPPTTPQESQTKALFLGADNYNYNSTIALLTFLAKFLYEETDIPENITFSVNRKPKTKLRFLIDDDGKSFICNKNDSKSNKADNIYVYDCACPYNETEETIEISYDGNQTAYAKYSLDNIEKQIGDIISSKGIIVLKDCFLDDKSQNSINGETTDTIPDNPEAYLFLTEGDEKKEIPLTFTKKASTNYQVTLNTKNDINNDLNNTLGVIKDNGQNKSLLLIFKEDTNSTMKYDYNPSVNKAQYSKKSSSGLSGGAIVAIILPCIAVLLAVLGLVFYLSKSSSGAVAGPAVPMENLGNNTLGISSSSYVVNK